MVVTFCGHGKISYGPRVEEDLRYWLEILIEGGANRFLLGGYGNFDMMAARVVKDLKDQFPFIRSTIVLPYLDKKYNKELYDDSIYPELENVPKRLAIIKRNEYMVDMSNAVIAYTEYDFGGAAETLRYAYKKDKFIIKLNAQRPHEVVG